MFRSLEGSGDKWTEWADFALRFTAQLHPHGMIEGSWVGECSTTLGQEVTSRYLFFKLIHRVKALENNYIRNSEQNSSQNVLFLHNHLVKLTGGGLRRRPFFCLTYLHLLDGQVHDDSHETKIMTGNLSQLSVENSNFVRIWL